MKTDKELNRIGKFLTLVLRHKPEEIDIKLDANGWANTKEIIKNISLTQEELDWIVANDNKTRFIYNENKSKIRANQGHSINVDIELDECTTPPEFLYHGTSTEVLSLILKDGIIKMSRNHVHLSKDLETAIIVGKRKGSNIVILKINTKELLLDNIKIYISKNGVYLADYIPAKYLDKTPIYIT